MKLPTKATVVIKNNKITQELYKFESLKKRRKRTKTILLATAVKKGGKKLD